MQYYSDHDLSSDNDKSIADILVKKPDLAKPILLFISLLILTWFIGWFSEIGKTVLQLLTITSFLWLVALGKFCMTPSIVVKEKEIIIHRGPFHKDTIHFSEIKHVNKVGFYIFVQLDCKIHYNVHEMNEKIFRELDTAYIKYKMNLKYL